MSFLPTYIGGTQTWLYGFIKTLWTPLRSNFFKVCSPLNCFGHTIVIGVNVAVVLRLARLGRHKSPVYRIVAAEKESRRDGRFLDIVGTYNPRTSPSTVTLKEDRVNKWLDVGAKPSDTVRSLIKRSLPGVIEGKEEHQTKKIQQARKKRKERTAKKAA